MSSRNLGCHGRRVELRRCVDPIGQPELLGIVAELVEVSGGRGRAQHRSMIVGNR